MLKNILYLLRPRGEVGEENVNSHRFFFSFLSLLNTKTENICMSFILVYFIAEYYKLMFNVSKTFQSKIYKRPIDGLLKSIQ